ncbi:PfkB family carbohydrate kinase [Sanguibacter massiliensis]|uniref:PfkB family carbohydrate kinase n=1 Tax=Sanguibacter massiliensis TaxID=1973217 RepID=UPI001F5CB208|nr:PfkB family carbohydrate kinase [Sanguibacter massiliensis]
MTPHEPLPTTGSTPVLAGPAGRALVVGEALIDTVRRTDGSVDEHPGGSPANVALTLGRLARDVELLTWIGEDAYGAMVRRWLEGSRVGLHLGSTGAPETSIATATLDASGTASYDFEIEWRLPHRIDVAPDTLVVHTGSLATALAPGADAVADLLAVQRRVSTVTFDPNVRPAILGRPLTAAPGVERFLMLADVVKVSHAGLAWLYPHRDPEVTAALWHKRSGAIVVLTRGADGASTWSAAGRVDVPGVPVEIADTVGAGDAFTGTLIDGLWSHDLLGAPRRAALLAIEPDLLRDVVARAVKAAAITTSRAGANPPRRAELDGPEPV